MPLTKLQKQALADELIDVMERFERDADQQYEAQITQPTSDHLVIKLQLADSIDESPPSRCRSHQATD
ncbi:hypothetical protein LPL18_005120 [Halomonas sp. CUBES01]|uniref:Uncharacterized protein n=1 Tax=Vreelandella gomseomensis TaxID=370766 RepID=A0ABU1GGF5_9GAMM|nr:MULTISPECIES: hypothetical protein [Halomonas]MDR5876557.1 hypothetical protein [Halomonas gomseomensis]MEC4766717.1 hypothetical protein [Halomonas sp. CUBES01]